MTAQATDNKRGFVIRLSLGEKLTIDHEHNDARSKNENKNFKHGDPPQPFCCSFILHNKSGKLTLAYEIHGDE